MCESIQMTSGFGLFLNSVQEFCADILYLFNTLSDCNLKRYIGILNFSAFIENHKG